jgi:hypothetical protein
LIKDKFKKAYYRVVSMIKKKVKDSSVSPIKSKKGAKTNSKSNKQSKIEKSHHEKTTSKNSQGGAELLEFKKKIPHLDEELVNIKSEENIKIDTSKAEKILDSKEDSPTWIKIIALIMFSGIILFWIMIIALSLSISTGQKIVERNVTAITYSPVKTNFSEYTLISEPSYSENVHLLGYLRKETITTGNIASTTKYITDDFGTKLRVISDSKYDELFTENSRYTYNVSGVYHNTLSGYVLDADNITKQARKLVEYREQRLENVTVGRKTGIYIDLSEGWEKLFKIIN